MQPNAPPEARSPEARSAPDDKARTENASAAFSDAAQRIEELKAAAVHFVAAKRDRLMLAVRQAVWAAIGAVVALICLAAVLVTSVVLLLRGVAGALAAICGHIDWLGDLLCGLLVLVFISATIWLMKNRSAAASRLRTMKTYEDLQAREQAAYGPEVKP
jgi:hypothetical protein